jgi:threonine dehydrogenase-like Zn-dependent dehydrogenase
MRAISFSRRLKYSTDYAIPVRAKNEALIKVSYAGICATDLEIIKGYMGFSGIPGHEFSGKVVESSDRKLVGRRVTGEINLSCGRCGLCRRGLKSHCPNRTVLGIYGKDGAFADYLTLPVKNLHPIPDQITDVEAVFIEPLAAAFEITRQVKIRKKDKVCVLGDGRLGILTAQTLALTGCEPMVIGRHREKLSILDGLGIKTELAEGGSRRYFDYVVDCTGSKSGLQSAITLVKPRGTVILKTTVNERASVDLNKLVIDEITVIGSRCGPFGPAIKALKGGTVRVAPLVTKIFSIEEGIKAFDLATRKGTIKVILKMTSPLKARGNSKLLK